MRDDPLIGRTIHGNLSINALLGEGGMGRVYLATNTEVREKRYAVKVLKGKLTGSATFQEHFYDEARHQALLDHPNIVQMIDYFHVDDEYFLVLEYVDGQPLSELIDSKGGKGLPEKQALTIAKGMLAGLDCAHRLAILHRDVKSSNVLVDRTGRARLTDFGIAMEAGGQVRGNDRRVVGTPAYMSPEQLKDSEGIDHRSDVYSAGVVMFEALTGRLPFTGDTFEAVQAQQLAHPAPDPRDFNPKIRKRVAEILRHAMRNDPAQRFQGCAQFLKALEKLDSDAWKYALVSACVLVAVSIYLVKAMIVDRQAIQNLVSTATRTYNELCKENLIRNKNANMKDVAAQEKFSDEVDMFNVRISENDKNMATLASDYKQTLERLSKFNQWTVRQVFDKEEPDPKIALVRPQMSDDYRHYLAAGTAPTGQEMGRECGRLNWHDF
jgi:serine/threonine protein kinase